MFNLATLLLTSQSHANASGLCQSDQWHCPMWQDAQPKSLNLPMDQGCSLFKSNWWPLHLYEAPFTAKASSCLQLLICRALDQQPADIVETLKESSFCWPSHTETPVGQQNTDANSFHSFNNPSVLPDSTFYHYASLNRFLPNIGPTTCFYLRSSILSFILLILLETSWQFPHSLKLLNLNISSYVNSDLLPTCQWTESYMSLEYATLLHSSYKKLSVSFCNLEPENWKSLSASPTGLIEVALRQVDSIGFDQWGSYGIGKFKQEELILEKCMKQVQSSLSSHCILVVILIAVDYGLLTLKA